MLGAEVVVVKEERSSSGGSESVSESSSMRAWVDIFVRLGLIEMLWGEADTPCSLPRSSGKGMLVTKKAGRQPDAWAENLLRS